METEETVDDNIVKNGGHTLFYAVHLPPDKKSDMNAANCIFSNKMDAMNLLKKYKKSRFKAFESYNDAMYFVLFDTDDEADSGKQFLIPENAPVGEKPIQFKMPKSQDLVKFRKSIENGDVQLVYKTMWDNPRYLIGNGDTPTILQEGFRYNALHIAARTKSWKMADLVLNTISDTAFVRLLYGDDCHQNPEERSKVLLDLYLNTPDKGLNETPLHFATKFGAVEVVEVLVSFAECDKNAKNKYGKTPAEVICSRCNDSNVTSVKNKIATLLEDNFYVPLIRSESDCNIPVVGEPFSPALPRNYNENPLQPRQEIHAYAGPLKKEEADRFRRIWKTPPRSLKSDNLRDEFPKLPRNMDSGKCLEAIGRELAAKYDIGWKEYWPFLDNFVDLTSLEGLRQLEEYLKERTSLCCSSTINSSPFCNALKRIVTLNDSKDIEFTENDHRKTSEPRFNDRSLSESSIDDQKSKESRLDHTSTSEPRLDSFLFIEKSCQVFANRISNEILLFKDDNSNEICLESSISQLQTLIQNFSSDNRFNGINLRRIHNRIGFLVACNLKGALGPKDKELILTKIREWLTKCDEICNGLEKNKESLCFVDQQTKCLLKFVLIYMDENKNKDLDKFMDEESYVIALKDGVECSCACQSYKIGRNDRNHSCNNIVRRLNFENSKGDLENGFLKSTPIFMEDQKLTNLNDYDSESDDEFQTPVGSPYNSFEMLDDDDDDDFQEAIAPEEDIFIEGNVPNPTDIAVFKALKRAESLLNPVDYPHIYKWHHAMKTHFKSNQFNFSPVSDRGNVSLLNQSSFSTPTKSWIRITGVNSPRNSLSSFSGDVNKFKISNINNF